jgi:hypothetical protein
MKKLALTIASTGYLAYTKLALASNVNDNINLNNAQTRGIAANESANNVVQNAITLAFTIAGVAVLAFLIFGAFQWITSGGAKEKVDAARKTITNALIGLALLGLAFLIVRIVGQIVGFDVLGQFDIPTLGRVVH